MVQHTARQETIGQALRFLLVGGANTLVTYAIFVGLGLIIAPWLAYTIAFAVGLAWVSFGSVKLVFRAELNFRRILLFCGWYLIVFGVGQLVIRVISPADFPSLLLTSLVVLLCTTPLTFLGGKFLFQPVRQSQNKGPQ